VDSPAATPPAKPDERSAARGEDAVLPVGYFTILQVLFAILLYSPGLVAFAIGLAFADVGRFFTTASIGAYIIAGCFA
jgi:hypothetical protein